MLRHGIKILPSDLWEDYGDTFFDSVFTPLTNSRDYWQLFYFRESEQEPRGYRRRSIPEARTVGTPEYQRQRLLQIRVRALLDDVFWLARGIGITTIPGIPTFEPKHLLRSNSGWIWLLFHAAWQCPIGTILRAGKFYPTPLMVRELRYEKNVKLPSASRMVRKHPGGL